MDQTGFQQLGECDCICHRTLGGVEVHHAVACCGYVPTDDAIREQIDAAIQDQIDTFCLVEVKGVE